MAQFPRLSFLRGELGLEVADIARRMSDGKPSVSSIYRLDTGLPIRLISVRKVFNVINDEWKKRGNDALNPDVEIALEMEK
ncbi:hypothetical protein [Jiella avicenniae]|uniref:Uncharacterized protein n=1 Tax=Jiella avicenniae TaxID=2907202 RepID=A0A9X1P7W2_9HYPH|nr:hypothetical protein [Jiella avicenniae]MCE7030918.1 hypothetical protein [Jiella avicenniae]